MIWVYITTILLGMVVLLQKSDEASEPVPRLLITLPALIFILAMEWVIHFVVVHV